MIRVGVIGLGTMGGTHAQAYLQLPNVKLVAAADLRPEMRDKLKGTDVTLYETGEELLEKADVDLVDVCVPTYLHRRFVEMAAAEGKHVFCEKPLARTIEDGQAMIEACRRAGVKLGVGHVVRFFPEYRKIKEAVESGHIGKPATATTMRGGGGFPSGWQDWYANFEWSGGLVLDLLIHDFDYLRWVFGEVDHVFARGTTGREYNRLEYALVTLRFRNGVIANVEGTWLDHGGFQTQLEITGQKGLLSYESKDSAPLRILTKHGTNQQRGVAVPESPLHNSPYFLEIKHFVECVERDAEPLINGQEALRALEISLAAIESIATGKPVYLNR